MPILDAALKLSGQRALLGAIHPEVRMVKLHRIDGRLTLTAICDLPFPDDVLDALTTAAAEIAADFPDEDIDENIYGSNDPIPAEDILESGWLYERAER